MLCPWYTTDIVARVAARENPPFRPSVSEQECPVELLDLMQRSWADNPDERPTFHAIRQIIRSIRK